MTGPRWSWNQPICGACYDRRYPAREPVRLRDPEGERCVDCGQTTDDGIYLRLDPTTARYPSRRAT